jgi:hypothetical protein
LNQSEEVEKWRAVQELFGIFFLHSSGDVMARQHVYSGLFPGGIGRRSFFFLLVSTPSLFSPLTAATRPSHLENGVH